MSYPHLRTECVEHHALVRDFGDSPDRMARPTIVTLCGSTRFKDEINAANARLTREGKLVISLGVFGHVDLPDHDWTTGGTDTKAGLDELHKRKIDLADEILVINVATADHPHGYIGESTRSEIAYAESIGKMVFYLEHAPGLPTVPVPEPQAARKRTNATAETAAADV